MPPGGWASALGAAILQGNRGYQDAVALQRQLAQQKFENQLRQRQADQTALLTQDRIKELPKEHAAADAATILAREGIGAFNNPTFDQANTIAGTPLQKRNIQPVIKARVNQVEGLPYGTANANPPPVESQGQAVRRMLGPNIAPDTGAVVPTQYVQAEADRQRKMQQDALFTDWLQRTAQQAGGSAPTGAPAPQDESAMPSGEQPPPRFDPQAYAKFQMDKASGIPTTEPVESDQHKLWMQTAELDAKAAHKPPSAATERERLAYAKVRELIPQFRQVLMTQVADPQDPTGQKMGIFGKIGQKASALGQKAQYDLGLPMPDSDSIAQQLAGAMRVIGVAPYMNGSRSQQMFNEAAVHVMDRGATPEAKLQRINELETIFPEFEKIVSYHAQQPQGAQRPQGPPQAAAPQAVPGAAKPGDTIPYALVVERAGKVGIDPKAMAAGLIQQGVHVTN